MLFAQAALALAACESIRRAPALAIALAKVETANATCHESSRNVNLCLAHCLGEDQSLDKPPVKVPPVLDAFVFVVPAATVVSHHDTRPQGRNVVRAWADPPARILFQSFLI
jgi:hypothetical protein